MGTKRLEDLNRFARERARKQRKAAGREGGEATAEIPRPKRDYVEIRHRVPREVARALTVIARRCNVPRESCLVDLLRSTKAVREEVRRIREVADEGGEQHWVPGDVL